MNIINRFLNRKSKKDKIKAYNKGCLDTDKIRDEKEKNKEKIFRNEIEKKEKVIEKLRAIIYKNDAINNELRKDLLRLKEELLLVENFIEKKQIKSNTDAIRKLAIIGEAEKLMRRVDKKLPESKKESEKSVIEANLIKD